MLRRPPKTIDEEHDEVLQQTVESTERSVQKLQESEQIGANTLVELTKQSGMCQAYALIINPFYERV